MTVRKFKVGDKVKNTVFPDYIGTVVYIEPVDCDIRPYDVVLDAFKRGHNGNAKGTDANNHWWFKEEELELVEADEDAQPSVNYRELTAPTPSEVKAVSSNPHYDTSIQPIETMQANMTPEEFLGYLKGNIIKYACRCGRKDEPLKEAKKIKEYAGWLVDALEGKKIDPRAN